MLQIVGQRVLVKPDTLQNEVKEIPGFQIVRPGDLEKAERNATDKGTVVQISPLAFKDIGGGDPWCAIGDKVIYAKHSGKWIKDPETNEEFYAIRDEDVQAIIVKDKDGTGS